MGRFVLKILALLVTWLIIQTGYDMRVRSQCQDYQQIVKTMTVYSSGVCYIADGPNGKFRKDK